MGACASKPTAEGAGGGHTSAKLHDTPTLGTTNVQASAGAVAPETRQQRAAPVPATAAGEQKGGKLSQAEAATLIQASFRGHLARTSPDKLGTGQSGGVGATTIAAEAPRVPGGGSPTASGGGRGVSVQGNGSGRGGSKATVRPPWGATPSAATAALRRGEVLPATTAKQTTRSPTPTRVSVSPSPVKSAGGSPAKASSPPKRTLSSSGGAPAAANAAALRSMGSGVEGGDSMEVPRYLQPTAATVAKVVKSPPRTTPPSDVRQPWGTRKAPGPTKRALGYKETPLPAPTDVGTAVRVLTSRPAAAGRDGAAPTTVVLSSDAAAVTSKVDSEPNAAVDKQPAVLKPTPQAEERLAEATLAVSSPPATAEYHSAPATNGALLEDGDLHAPVGDVAAEVALPQEPALKVEEPIHESPVQRPPPPPPPPQPSSSAETLLGSHPVAADDDEEAAAEDAHRQVSAGPAGAPQAAVPEGIAV